jgi:hypothetical protein
MTPAQLAAKIDRSEGFSTSNLAKQIRKVARKRFPRDAPGKGGRWHFTRKQVAVLSSDPRIP